MNIVHLSSVHTRSDVRIFIKECRSLVVHGYEVTLIVADDKGNELLDNVKIVDVGQLPGRLNRILKTTQKIYQKANSLGADLYHLHDPELIPLGLMLKRKGRNVIFDSHEDVPQQLLTKPYLGRHTLKILAIIFSYFERYSCAYFNGIIAATPAIRNKFLKINPNTVDINNYPLSGELESPVSWENKQIEICYVGGIDSIRGIREMISAMTILHTPARLNLAGRFHEPHVEVEVKGSPGWARVNELGFLDRAGVREILGRSLAGLVTLRPLPNYIDSQPIKMFEYMSAGIPVIASNFPLWREIIEGNRCGLCVDPLDPKAIAGAIDYLVTNPQIARQMGENGKRAVLEKYNWAVEEEKLVRFYRHLLSQ